MDPLSLAVISLGATAAGAGVSAIGVSQQASANAASARYSAQVARNNEIIAGGNAEAAQAAGRSKAEAQDYKTRFLIGEQKVNQAASGVDVNSGSPLAVRASTAELGRLDALTLLYNADKEAVGFKNKANEFQSESVLQEAKAKNYENAGSIGVATSLLGGASSFSDKWISYSNKIPGWA